MEEMTRARRHRPRGDAGRHGSEDCAQHGGSRFEIPISPTQEDVSARWPWTVVSGYNRQPRGGSGPFAHMLLRASHSLPAPFQAHPVSVAPGWERGPCLTLGGRRWVLGVLLWSVTAGCGSDVRTEDGSGATGAGVTGAAPGTGGSGGGTDSGTGGVDAGPGVPGCEQLVLHPDALVIPDGMAGQILPIDDADLAIIYRAASDDPDILWDTRSRRLVGAFDLWPPAVSEPLIHGNHQLDLTVPAHARSDGAFVARGFYGWFVGSIYDESVLVSQPPGSPAYPILEPEPGGGVFWSYEGDVDLYATLEAEEPWQAATFPTALSVRSHGVGFDGTTLIVDDAQLYTWSGAWSGLDGDPKPAEFDQILYRPNGFYLRDYLTLYPYDSDGWLPSLKLEGPATGQNWGGFDGPNHAASAWRGGGVAVAVLAQAQPNEVWVAVTDAVLTTSTTRADLGACASHGISIVASPDGAHLYVGFLSCEADPAFIVRRFDCLPAGP